MLARVRGIYATAVTKLLLDGGFEITQPSKPIQERFKLEPRYVPPDVTVKDLEPPIGVLVIGECNAVERALEILSKLSHTFVVRSPVPLHAVIMGEVAKVGEELVVKLREGLYAKAPRKYVLSKGYVGVFTVVRTPLSPKESVLVEPDVYTTGKYVSIVPGGRTILSEHIRDPEKQRLLTSLASMFKDKLGAYGLKFRSSAKYAGIDELISEIEHLLERLNAIPEKARRSPPHAVLEPGECIAKVVFSREARLELDDVRNSVVPTTRLHHVLKMFSRRGDVVELLDGLSASCSRDQAENHIEDFLLRKALRIEIMHIKPWGDFVRMHGDVVHYDGRDLVVARRLKPGGTLDGLGVPKEEGDYALTCIRRGEWFVVHTYYRKCGEIKGTYVNINTPPEFTKLRALYIDLLVDVVVGEEAKVLDVEELERCEYIPRELKDRVLSLARSLVNTPMECSDRGIVVKRA